MSDKSSKPKKAKKAARSQPSVLGSLSATRPEPIGRRGATKTAATAPAARAKATARAKAKPEAVAKAKRAAAATPKPKAAARPKRAAAATPKPKAAARPRRAAAATPKPKAAARPKPAAAPGIDDLRASAARMNPASGDARRRAPGPPSGPELVTTAIQAAGELAQIGLTLGGQMLRQAARRIPRP
jgi:hypothetical protein